MSNRYRNEVTVSLNGNAYVLRATFNALVEIEDALKMSFPKVQQALFEHSLTVKQGLTIFKAAAKAAGQKFDEEQIKKDIEIGGVEDFGVALVEFLRIALFGSEKLKKKSASNASQASTSIGNRIWASLLASCTYLLKRFGR